MLQRYDLKQTILLKIDFEVPLASLFYFLGNNIYGLYWPIKNFVIEKITNSSLLFQLPITQPLTDIQLGLASS
jgi:hypothetical protein